MNRRTATTTTTTAAVPATAATTTTTTTRRRTMVTTTTTTTTTTTVVPRWFPLNEDKAWTEKVFLGCSVFWLSLFSLVVVTKVYLSFGDWEFMTLGLIVSLPYLLVPPLLLRFQSSSSSNNKKQRRKEGGGGGGDYWWKANVWLGVFGFIGNYFWTHYFYQVLGAGYSFPVAIQLNQVPFFLYLVTHAYFCFYHTLTNLFLRRVWTSHFYHSLSSSSSPFTSFLRVLFSTVLVFFLGYFTAFMEAFTISSVPYYHYPDAFTMYAYGSVFYGIYFYVSFPMFLRIDEEEELELGRKGEKKRQQQQEEKKWSLSRTFGNSLAACMAVTCLLDFWRLFIGHVAGVGNPARLPLIAQLSPSS